ncbi:MAG TPA: hypothetical protein VJT83_10020, partial [Chitinophagaceae bacterium]|nr:hypothetical protein [Chitinophagaceae bacterium]
MEVSESIQADLNKNGKTLQGTGSPYPSEPLPSSLEKAKAIIAANGTTQHITKDSIAKTLQKALPTLNLTFSTWTQYCIFTNFHGKGYLPSETYNKYVDHAYPQDERR